MITVATQRAGVYDAMSKWEELDPVERALRLRAALVYAELNQSDLAKLLLVSQTILNRWANARGIFPWPRWVSIASICEVPYNWTPSPALLRKAWEDWRDEADRKGKRFSVAEPAKNAHGDGPSR